MQKMKAKAARNAAENQRKSAEQRNAKIKEWKRDIKSCTTRAAAEALAKTVPVGAKPRDVRYMEKMVEVIF